MEVIKAIKWLPRPLRRRRLLRLLTRIVPNSAEALITFNSSATLYANVNDISVWITLQTDHYYPQFEELAAVCLAGGGTYFDVGANVGFLTFGIIPVIDPSLTKFHLFEASEYNCRMLQKSAAHHLVPSLVINRVCVTDVAGTSRLVTNGDSGLAHIAEQGSEEVPNLRLDDYVREYGIPRVELLKLDIEGWEPHAVRGFHNAMSEGRVPIVYSEISGETLARSGWTPKEYLKLLSDLDYRYFLYRHEDLDGHDVERTELHIRGRRIEVGHLAEIDPNCHTDILAVHRSALASGAVTYGRARHIDRGP
jgi:FkbM family methyltransferase